MIQSVILLPHIFKSKMAPQLIHSIHRKFLIFFGVGVAHTKENLLYFWGGGVLQFIPPTTAGRHAAWGCQAAFPFLVPSPLPALYSLRAPLPSLPLFHLLPLLPGLSAPLPPSSLCSSLLFPTTLSLCSTPQALSLF